MTLLITALHMGGRGFGFGWLFPILLVLALVGLLVWWLVRGRRRAAAPEASAVAQPAPQDAAHAILAERFARGEIDPDEYLRRVGVLRGVPESTQVAGPTVVGTDTPDPATPAAR